MSEKFRTMIVPVEIVDQCRAMADTWPGGEGMFVVPLHTGPDITHYMSSGLIDGTIAQQMPWTDYSGAEPTEHPGDVPALVESINEQNPGSPVTDEFVQTLCDQCDISTQSWREACERLGVTLEATDE